MTNVVSIAEHTDSLILGALEPRERRALLAKGHSRHYNKGEVLFSRGDDGGWLLLIEEGIVEISIMSLNGRKSVLNHMERGEILGEIALLDREPRSADAVAISEVSGTLLNRPTILEALRQNSDACFSIIETLCGRVRNASEMFETQSLTSANTRLARCLIRIAKKWGQIHDDGTIKIDQHFSQTDLGELAGVARENVNRHLQAWIQDQTLTFDKGEITLLDPDRLSEIAEL